MNYLRQPHAHTLKLACAYTHPHIHTHVHLHTLKLILSYTCASTHTYTRTHCRGWWEAQKGLLFAPGHTAQLGQAWNYFPSWPFPNWASRTTRGTSVSGCMNSEWSLFATSQQLMPEQATNWVHSWAFMSLEQVSQLHCLREKHSQFSGQAELCWHITGQWGNQHGLARTCHLIIPEEQEPNISTENQITPRLLERKQDL